MFVAPVEPAPIVQAACTDAIAVVQRKLLLKHLAEAGHDGGDPWLRDVEQATLAALAARGSATAAQLSADEPRLRTPAVDRRGQVLRRRARDHSPGAQPALHAGADRPGPAARHVAVHAIRVGTRRRLGRGRPAPARRRGRPRRAGPAVAGAVRPGDTGRPQVVGGLDGRPGQGRAGRARHRRGDPRRRRDRVSCWPTTPRRSSHPTRGWRCCRPSTRRSWVGSAASGTSGRTRPPCSTAPATPARRSGSTAGVVGGWSQRAPTARSSTDYCEKRVRGRERRRRSTPGGRRRWTERGSDPVPTVTPAVPARLLERGDWAASSAAS